MSIADAEALIKLVDTNGDGQLQLAEFLDLMATPGALTLMPPPPADAEARLAAFEAETRVVKKSSPVLKEFKKVAAHDPSLTSLALSVSETDNALNMEFRMWSDTRKAAALALISGSPVITSLNLASSRRMRDSNCAAVPPKGSPPAARITSTKLGSRINLLISVFNRRMISWGVLAGARIPNQPTNS